MKKNGWIPLDRKKRKWKIDWRYWLALLIFLVGGYVVKSINDAKVVNALKEGISTAESNMSKLSSEEVQVFYSVRDKMITVCGRHLTEAEFADFIALSQKNLKGTLTIDEIDRGNAYLNKVRSNMTPEEKRIMDAWETLVRALAKLQK